MVDSESYKRLTTKRHSAFENLARCFRPAARASKEDHKGADLPAKRVSFLKRLSSVTLHSPVLPKVRYSQLPDILIELIVLHLVEEGDLSFARRLRLVSKQMDRVAVTVLPNMSRWHTLPDEILLEIFSAVRFNTSSTDAVADLASCLRVSPHWYRVGMPLLYRHFVMDVNYQNAALAVSSSYLSGHLSEVRSRYNFIPSARFYDTATKLWSQPWTDEGLGAWIHSLSMEIHFQETEPVKHMNSIADVIKELPNLRTFSVRAAPLRQNNIIIKSKFTDLIRNMPKNIVNFELDLQSRDTVYTLHSQLDTRFCEALGSVLPQLRTLRLRLAAMCTDFLSSVSTLGEECPRSCPDLRSLSISVYTREFTPMAHCCSATRFPYPSSNATELMDTLQARIRDRTTFPNLKSCALICLRHDMSAPNTLPRRLICKNFDPRLRTWSKRAYFPCADGIHQPLYFRTDADGDEAETIMHGISDHGYGARRVPSGVHLTHGKVTDAIFEGDSIWTEDAFGARYPPHV